MNKNQKNYLNLALNIGAVVLGIVALCMIFVDACCVKFEGESVAILTGIQATFGYTHETVIADVEWTTFSFMNLLPYLFVLAAVVLVALRYFKVIKDGAVDWVAIGLFAVAGILYFLVPQFVVYEETMAKSIEAAIEAGATKNLMVGSIIAAITSLVSAITLAVNKLVVNKK